MSKVRRRPRVGDIVRHRGTGNYFDFGGHYGIVQTIRRHGRGDKIPIGVEWDLIPHTTVWHYGHSLHGILIGVRAHSGWYVAPEDVEVV